MRSSLTQNARASSARRNLRSSQRRVSLAETLERVLNKGAVIVGDVVISVADIDLLYLGVNVVACSVETMRRWQSSTHVSPEGEGGAEE